FPRDRVLRFRVVGLVRDLAHRRAFETVRGLALALALDLARLLAFAVERRRWLRGFVRSGRGRSLFHLRDELEAASRRDEEPEDLGWKLVDDANGSRAKRAIVEQAIAFAQVEEL